MIQRKNEGTDKTTYNYQYPKIIFRNLNMCKQTDILTDSIASDIEQNIYQKILTNHSLGKELNKYLRDHYLIEISYSDEE